MKKILVATVILIATALIFSSFAIAEDTNPLQLSTKAQVSIDSSQIKGNLNRVDIVWDNGPIDDTSNGLSSQFDTAYPFNSQVADDFQLQQDTMITDVHWWGAFWNPAGSPVNPADFNIIFYADAGGMPTGAGMPDPTPTALKVYTIPQVNGIPTGGTDEFEYDVVLPEPFQALANEIYWIAIQWKGDYPPQWGWETNGANPEKLSVSVQGFPLLGTNYWTPNTAYGDMAFYLTGPEIPEPAICCEGSLVWENVKTLVTVNGTFQVCNCGDPGSLLNWKVDTASIPAWGTWTFTPSSGTGLAQPDCVTITVEVKAPAQKKKTFTGKIKMINSDDPTDFCEIDVSLKTPRAINGFSLMQWILQRYPNMFPILRNILA
jgi:hypothetical protein